jgi:hypothetical protein
MFSRAGEYDGEGIAGIRSCEQRGGLEDRRFDVLRIDRVEYRQGMCQPCRNRSIENRKADGFEEESPVPIAQERFET